MTNKAIQDKNEQEKQELVKMGFLIMHYIINLIPKLYEFEGDEYSKKDDYILLEKFRILDELFSEICKLSKTKVRIDLTKEIDEEQLISLFIDIVLPEISR